MFEVRCRMSSKGLVPRVLLFGGGRDWRRWILGEALRSLEMCPVRAQWGSVLFFSYVDSSAMGSLPSPPQT